MRIIHWFRNDLRLQDNTALLAAASAADELVPLFVIDPRLLGKGCESAARARFLLDCLARLDERLRERGSGLVVRRGDPRALLPRLAVELGVARVEWNRDYTPYARARDRAVRRVLERDGVRVVDHKDRVVREAAELRTGSGGAYSVFTPYRRSWWRRWREEPLSPGPRLKLPPLPTEAKTETLPDPREAELGLADDLTSIPTGGETAARRRLARFVETSLEHYPEQRDLPGVDGTSRLSPYLRLGVISVRSCLHAALEAASVDARLAAGAEKWADELVWREFYSGILEENPHVLRGAYRPEYDRLQWADDPDGSGFAAWCRGETGFPFVDAAMRQLVATGWMHNRARMVVASFLTKDLGIDWRAGERFFMQHLVDGDPASNNGGWQWSASTGTDAQPWFRIFNPVSQSERFDPDGDYIRRWIPELSGATGRALHRPWEAPLETAGYPAPVVDHAEARTRTLARYKAVRGG